MMEFQKNPFLKRIEAKTNMPTVGGRKTLDEIKENMRQLNQEINTIINKPEPLPTKENELKIRDTQLEQRTNLIDAHRELMK